LYGIGVLEPEKEEHPTTPQIVEVHQRRADGKTRRVEAKGAKHLVQHTWRLQLLVSIELTFDLSNRARMHSMMRRRYFELLVRVAGRLTCV